MPIKFITKVERIAVALATTAATGGLNHLDVPHLERVGMWADLAAGGIFIFHQLHHRWTAPKRDPSQHL